MFQVLVTFTTNKFRSQIQTRGFILKLGSQLYVLQKEKKPIKKGNMKLCLLLNWG